MNSIGKGFSWQYKIIKSPAQKQAIRPETHSNGTASDTRVRENAPNRGQQGQNDTRVRENARKHGQTAPGAVNGVQKRSQNAD